MRVYSVKQPTFTAQMHALIARVRQPLIPLCISRARRVQHWLGDDIQYLSKKPSTTFPRQQGVYKCSWLNSDSGSLKGALSIPSNVTRLSRAVRPQSSDGIPQVVYYHFGVGASGGVVDRIYGGASGAGLAEIVREGYTYIATNYHPGDEIFIFGFSRGAFTARSIAGLIDNIGLLTKEGLPYLAEVFRDIQHQHDEHYRPKHPDVPFHNKIDYTGRSYGRELERLHLTRLGINIKVVGVFDTVGALGTPKIGWLRRVGLQSSASRELSFYDTSLSDCVENAFQALALDERRYAFQPTLWEKHPDNTSTLRQVWFPGAHSNVGGGYDDQQIANITLAWMMSQCSPFLDFNPDYILDEMEMNDTYYERNDQKIRPWSFGKIFDGMAGFYALGGSAIRTPGRYCAIDHDTGRETRDPLMDTHEYVHASVRARLKLGGPGISDRGVYDCKALQDWKLNIEQPPDGRGRPNIYWKLRTRQKDVSTRVMPEAPLWGMEKELLDYDRETRDYVMRPAAIRQRRSRNNRRTSAGGHSPLRSDSRSLD
ncbi:hypothetical protein AMS68_000684 [Peltaster fructicola]|uniref:T6SS Phospholipase effector Tle1-like catalytic domain-containing protein n=1 Tax=Peltaster fructicola TaxID=286661 RepID=A0A6H0XK95_9PEZI|nr:hypothetical protein AMS68_000684 [Peltaster fructicola]